MTLRQHASILLTASALIACAGAAQEAHPPSVDGREFRIYSIYLAGTAGKPLSIKANVAVESTDGTEVVSKQWVEQWIRDQDGRVWGRVYAPREDYPGKLPPLMTVWWYDAIAKESTICSVADRKCQVYQDHAPYPVSFLRVGGGSTVCMVNGVCLAPQPHERVICGDQRLEQTFLGEYSIGGISMDRIRMMCYKPDGSGGGVDVWHNSEFDLDFYVNDVPPKGEVHYRIDQISSSVPDDPKLFQVPPAGYSMQPE